MKKQIIWIPLIGMISLLSCDQTQVKPNDDEPVVIVVPPPVYGINIVLSLEDNTNVSLNKGGKYYLDNSNEKEWIVNFIPFDNYEVKEVFENGVSLGKIKTYSYKRDKDINLKIIFGFTAQMEAQVTPFWQMYVSIDSNIVTHESNLVISPDSEYLKRILKFEPNGQLFVYLPTKDNKDTVIVGVYMWYFVNEKKIYFQGDIYDYKISENIMTITSFPFPNKNIVRTSRHFDIKHPKPPIPIF